MVQIRIRQLENIYGRNNVGDVHLALQSTCDDVVLIKKARTSKSAGFLCLGAMNELVKKASANSAFDLLYFVQCGIGVLRVYINNYVTNFFVGL